jgi:riboflavin biosynthesis pyrimidine reductase
MTAARCEERVHGLYGEGLLQAPAVLQPMAVWNDGSGRLFTLLIGEASPDSATDRFVLGLARARVDAIVTTGRILRDEPDVTHSLGDPDLDAWRVAVAGRDRPPVSVILTARDDLDFAHPVFGAEEVLVVTSEEVEPVLASRAPDHVEIVGRAYTALRETVRWLHEDRGFASVSVEAGPSSSLELYRAPVRVDELMLSVYQSPSLPDAARGGSFLDVADLDRLFPVGAARRSECTREEESGRWSFCRFSSRS